MWRRVPILAVVALTGFVSPAAAAVKTVQAGAARLELADGPFRMQAVQAKGRPLPAAGLSFRDQTGWHEAIRTTALRGQGRSLRAEVLMAGGRSMTLMVVPAREGSISLTARAPSGADRVRMAWSLGPGEALLGSGERSDGVDRRGIPTENYVADGPFRAEDRAYVAAFSPPWATRDRDDATYFPVPWLLTSRGWGLHVAQDDTSRFVPAGERAWTVEVDSPRMTITLYAGPTPARALRRFTAATGRQPPPSAPWAFGPWFQTGQPNVVPVEEERAITKLQRDAGVPVSVAETQMHFLPCGAHEGREAAERERTASFHRDGLARLVYLNPSLCVSYGALFERARRAGALQQVPGLGPFVYPAFVGGAAPLGFSIEPLAQFDFTHPATERILADVVGEIVEQGNDGWMEDFGEATPPGIVQHDGSTGDIAHNRYPRDYHCALRRIAKRFDRPLVRFQRSGWTGAAACADVVWGGDPTTLWGFDGLSSAVTQMLSAGLSGIARWGTDIGGYNSFGAGSRGLKPGETEEERLTPELLSRWIEFGALAPVMRTKRSGLAVPSYNRPQVFDPEHLGLWRRMTELHLQLNRYLAAADERYRRSGLPIARHLLLEHPEIRVARDVDDQYLLGPDLLAAPVTAPGLRERRVFLPPGRWMDWWSATRFDDRDGAYRLRAQRPFRGGGYRTVPAPIGRPPLMVRAGAILPLLPADIDTLTNYGEAAGLVRLSDRRKQLRVLAFPRGETSRNLGDGAHARSVVGRGRWELRLRARQRTRFELEAGLAALGRRFHPRELLLDGDVLKSDRWTYDRESRVLRTKLRGTDVRLVARN